MTYRTATGGSLSQPRATGVRAKAGVAKTATSGSPFPSGHAARTPNAGVAQTLAPGILALLACLAGPGTVRAEEKIHVTVVAILATDQDKKVEPCLECLAKEVQKTDPTLTGFRVAKGTCKKLEVGQKFKFALVEDEVAAVVVKHGCDKEDRVGLTVKAPLVGEIAYTSACGKFFPIMTRYQTKNKERLIIAIRVQPCPCKK